MTPLPIQLPKGGGVEKIVDEPLPMLLHATFLQNPESRFSSSLLSLYTENLHLSRFTWASLFYYIVSKSLLTVLRDLKIKVSFKVKKSILVRSEVGRSLPVALLLEQKEQYIRKKIILIFTF